MRFFLFSFFNEWIDHWAFHEAPLGNAIVCFEPHFVVISLFSLSTSSYLLIDSRDVQAAFQGILEFHSFTRPSRAAMSVGTSLFYPLTHLTPWGCELRRIPWDGEITIKPPAPVTKGGFAESCTSVLHFGMGSPEVGLWARFGFLMKRPVFIVPVPNQEVDFPGALGIGCTLGWWTWIKKDWEKQEFPLTDNTSLGFITLYTNR